MYIKVNFCNFDWPRYRYDVQLNICVHFKISIKRFPHIFTRVLIFIYLKNDVESEFVASNCQKMILQVMLFDLY